MKQQLEVRITGDHPHAGETGTIEIEEGIITLVAPLGIGKPDMALVTLDACQHGANGCYAKQANIQVIAQKQKGSSRRR